MQRRHPDTGHRAANLDRRPHDEACIGLSRDRAERARQRANVSTSTRSTRAGSEHNGAADAGTSLARSCACVTHRSHDADTTTLHGTRRSHCANAHVSNAGDYSNGSHDAAN